MSLKEIRWIYQLKNLAHYGGLFGGGGAPERKNLHQGRISNRTESFRQCLPASGVITQQVKWRDSLAQLGRDF